MAKYFVYSDSSEGLGFRTIDKNVAGVGDSAADIDAARDEKVFPEAAVQIDIESSRDRGNALSRSQVLGKCHKILAGSDASGRRNVKQIANALAGATAKPGI